MRYTRPKFLASGLVVVITAVAGCPSSAPDADQRSEQAPPPALNEGSAQDNVEAPIRLEKLANLDALRDAFNADAAKGRAILLLEPG